MIDIIVKKRKDDFHAHVKDHPELWSAGRDYNSAVGNLIITHQDCLGLNLIYEGLKWH